MKTIMKVSADGCQRETQKKRRRSIEHVKKPRKVQMNYGEDMHSSQAAFEKYKRARKENSKIRKTKNWSFEKKNFAKGK